MEKHALLILDGQVVQINLVVVIVIFEVVVLVVLYRFRCRLFLGLFLGLRGLFYFFSVLAVPKVLVGAVLKILQVLHFARSIVFSCPSAGVGNTLRFALVAVRSAVSSFALF